MEREQPTRNYIFGIRAVIEALEAGRDIDKIFIRKDLQGDLVAQLFEMLRGRRIVVQRVQAERLDRITRRNHQGVIAFLGAVTYHRLDHVVPELFEAGRVPFVVLLDGLTDVRNFGAIVRTCECAAVDAVVIPERGSVSAGPDAMKTSAGALNHIPVCRERSIFHAVRYLRESGFRIVSVSEKADINYTCADYTVPTALVMGAEDIGISEEVIRESDLFVSIPMFGKIGSLNVSVATGIVVYEVVRQRLAANEEVI
ncbi:MAG: 23S rRNA (guanosine(2251)-2'-O)-methyltransferase RlmB [Clostridium sp.]|nr:23S rRNA (guanosine(2251)-2'-O)-methyltransferase RlmB [Clostridium sp.]